MMATLVSRMFDTQSQNLGNLARKWTESEPKALDPPLAPTIRMGPTGA